MKYLATFTPQAWQRGYAITVDPDGPTEWDVTDKVLALSEEDREDVLNKQPEPWNFNDDLRDDPHAPQWVRDWDGPFEISVREVQA